MKCAQIIEFDFDKCGDNAGMGLKDLVKVATPAVAVLCASYSQAATYGFDCITNNIAGDCAIGEAQLTVDVTDAGGNQVLFTFNNAGPDASSITNIYFDDGTLGVLLGIAGIDNSHPGVSFSIDLPPPDQVSPPDLPGGNNLSPPFNVTQGLLADSDSPIQPNGVNPGEYVGILFDLHAGISYLDVLADIGSADLRIGIHVQGFETGGSESFVNYVPVPAAAWLFASGLLGLVGVARRKRA